MEVIKRLFAAVVGGYIFSNIVAILVSYLLPTSRAEAVVTSILLSFLVYTASIIWVFSARTILHAWLGLLVPALIGAITIYLLFPSHFA